MCTENGNTKCREFKMSYVIHNLTDGKRVNVSSGDRSKALADAKAYGFTTGTIRLIEYVDGSLESVESLTWDERTGRYVDIAGDNGDYE